MKSILTFTTILICLNSNFGQILTSINFRDFKINEIEDKFKYPKKTKDSGLVKTKTSIVNNIAQSNKIEETESTHNQLKKTRYYPDGTIDEEILYFVSPSKTVKKINEYEDGILVEYDSITNYYNENNLLEYSGTLVFEEPEHELVMDFYSIFIYNENLKLKQIDQ